MALIEGAIDRNASGRGGRTWSAVARLMAREGVACTLMTFSSAFSDCHLHAPRRAEDGASSAAQPILHPLSHPRGCLRLSTGTGTRLYGERCASGFVARGGGDMCVRFVREGRGART
jgi:hypothetical protein